MAGADRIGHTHQGLLIQTAQAKFAATSCTVKISSAEYHSSRRFFKQLQIVPLHTETNLQHIACWRYYAEVRNEW